MPKMSRKEYLEYLKNKDKAPVLEQPVVEEEPIVEEEDDMESDYQGV